MGKVQDASAVACISASRSRSMDDSERPRPFVIEVQSGVRGPTGRVLSQSFAQEMVAPVGVGPFAFGLMVERRGEG
jgi:hypothetical protein